MTNQTTQTALRKEILERGQRLQTARKLTGFSRRMIEQKYGISPHTLNNWENGKAGGLTDQGAKRVIPFFREEGVLCSLSWLMHGIGSPPALAKQMRDKSQTSNSSEIKAILTTEDEDNAITEEIECLRSLYKDVVDFIVPDDVMQPAYNIGEHVAGQRHYREAIAEAVGYDCIIELASGDIYLRRLKQADEPGHYHLMGINPDTLIKESVLYNQQIMSAAPIIWIRRKKFK